ncbi:MAG TPA: LacI family DNA-binding transcriptional regulator [Balneolaceae bacterium]|nr:LacI family DNA-binding transcriptional regulator [Balneolaceae bacterium]
MKITLKDIANDTGFSVATVSRVLNGSSKISTETQDIVLESAKRLEYLSPKQTGSASSIFLDVAFLISNFSEGEFYVSLFDGLNRASKKNNIRLSLMGILDSKKEIPKLIKEISLHYDAAILFIPEFTRLDYEKLLNKTPNGFPIISNALIENPVFPTVTFDGYSGGYLVAKYFEEKSYSSLGLIQGPFERAEARYRNNGFRDYIQQKKNLHLDWLCNGDFTFEAGVKAYKKFRKLKQKPHAIFAGNDDMANGFMEAAKAEGVNFPKDIAIMGYDNLPVCRHNHPTISSVKTDYEALGKATMKLLRDSIKEPGQDSNMVSFVSVSIMQRESA